MSAVWCAGCSGGTPWSAAKTGNSAPVNAETCATATHGWVRSDLQPASQPVVAGCDLVVYDASHGLRVVALDARDGHTVWQVASAVASVTPGVSPALMVVNGVVVMFADGGGAEKATLVGVDARSGAIRWHSAPGAFSGWPTACPDEDTVVCVSNQDPLTGHTQVMRFAATDGHPLASPVISNAAGRDLAPGLYDPGNRNPDLLVAVNGGAVAWDQPLGSVFTVRGLSTDNGWNFDRIPATGLFVGSVDGPPVSESANAAVIDLTRTMTAGFKITNGRPVWTDPGSQYVCSVLPCPGTANPNASGYQPPTLGLRLRGTGTIHITIHPEHASFSPGAHIALEGFDLATGKTRWSVNAGQDLALIENTTPPRFSTDLVALPDATNALDDPQSHQRHTRAPPAERGPMVPSAHDLQSRHSFPLLQRTHHRHLPRQQRPLRVRHPRQTPRHAIERADVRRTARQWTRRMERHAPSHRRYRTPLTAPTLLRTRLNRASAIASPPRHNWFSCLIRGSVAAGESGWV